MAVYTHLTDKQIANCLDTHFGVGRLMRAQTIAEGIENSNYLITCERDGEETPYILTLFEKRTNEADLPFFMELLEQLDAANINVPLPQKTQHGQLFVPSQENEYQKPISVVSFLEGKQAKNISLEKLRALGAYIATMHRATQGLELARENSVGKAKWAQVSEPLKGRLDAFGDAESLIVSALDKIENAWPARDALPRGIIHADLFPDNVFFENEGQGDAVSGIIDWYFACEDCYAYDLAIVINAWCFDGEWQLMLDRVDALLEGYESVRPLDAVERNALPILCVGAALRFLLTRLHDWVNHDDSALVTPKDPKEYIAKLRHFLDAI